jgi:hypothetical protein
MNPINVFLILLYDMTLIAGATWLVVEKDWSMWTYLLALCFLYTISNKTEK